jgi:HEAT repeat protein
MRLAVAPVEKNLQYVEINLAAVHNEQTYQVYHQVGASKSGSHDVFSAFKRGWELIAYLRQLDAISDKKLIKALTHENEQVRYFVVDRMAMRKSPAFKNPLLELVRKGEPDAISLRAVGALVAMNIKDAVPMIIDLSRRGSPEFVVQTIFAVAEIGGSLAEGYLVTMASGHPHPGVQSAAKQALKELANY